jgi:tRNA G18 (ribose-2'-O)-methylase SpoU
MPGFLIESQDDPRLDPYRDLKSAESRLRETFIAEGEKLVLRLLDSPCSADSILCTTTIRDRLGARLPQGIPIYVTSTPVISRLIGFQFHRGILACGRRPAAQNLESLCVALAPSPRSLIVLCPEIRDPANLGTIIRTAAAFGASALVAGGAGTDPFSRRVLRTSMGTVLRLPIVQTDNWEAAVKTLHQAGHETIAAVLDPAAELLAAAPCPRRAAVLLGNEDEGLPADLVARCQRRVTLPMAEGVDSLNVAVAAGIVLCHFANLPPRLDPG